MDELLSVYIDNASRTDMYRANICLHMCIKTCAIMVIKKYLEVWKFAQTTCTPIIEESVLAPY